MAVAGVGPPVAAGLTAGDGVPVGLRRDARGRSGGGGHHGQEGGDGKDEPQGRTAPPKRPALVTRHQVFLKGKHDK
ncbi:hypothetical protein GCM10010350_28800 [Streptomyces galilaeus]|nr:hypothetical protein GCM10010350_28800 [Streptomyces galilaeus]